MQRAFTDLLNLSAQTRRIVQKRFPDEEVRFATAVTILKSSREEPVGWTFRRIFQRRGNVVITDERIYLQASFFSGFTVLWLVVLGWSVFGFVETQTPDPVSIFLSLVAVMFLLQRLPFEADLPRNGIRGVRFGRVRGLSATCDIMAIATDGPVYQLVTSKNVPAELCVELSKLPGGAETDLGPIEKRPDKPVNDS